MSRCAFVFPGQGAQFPGMGRELCDEFDVSRAVFDIVDDALEPQGISAICFEGSVEELALTENTQPALLTVSIAALRALESRGVRAVAAAGHSLGEYSAHVAAGTIELADAARAVRARGRFMQQAVPVGQGAMAAVLGLDLERLVDICADAAQGEVVTPANLNAPGQIVIAGHAEAVGRAGRAASAAGAMRVVPLTVSAPFHCSLMAPAATELQPVLERMEFKTPAFPVYTNVDAGPVEEAGAAREALLRQVAAPVRWQETIERMIEDGIDCFVEIGAGKVLSGLVRRIDRKAKFLSVGDPEGVDRAVEALA